MIILCKLPPTMEVVAQILSQTSPDEIKNLKPEGIVKAATLSFEQKGTTRGVGGGWVLLLPQVRHARPRGFWRSGRAPKG